MNVPTYGQVLRAHLKEGFKDIGRVVLVLGDCDAFWYVPFPHDPSVDKEPGKNGRRGVAYDVAAPRRVQCSELQECHSFVDYVPPSYWLVSEDELRTGVLKSDVVGHRADLVHWRKERESNKALIAEITDSYGAYELLELGQLNALVRDLAKKGSTPHRKLRRLVRLHLFGCEHRNALLPRLARSGGRGTVKFSKTKTGRPRDAVARGKSREKGFVCSPDDRQNLLAGWRKYKKPGVSVYDSYLLTCVEFWPGSVSVKRWSKNYRLAEPLKRPTLGQFKAEARRANESAASINMGKRVHDMCQRALRGSAKDGVVAVGQAMLIDSTSEDQTPVSEVNSLIVLPSTWRTVVFDVRTGYIFGLHCGFESPSTQTSLMAIQNAATPKQEFCQRWGVELTEGEWHSRMPKRVRADNGELKSVSGIETLNQSETSLEFTRSYDATMKGELEANHRSLHAHADHKNAASTHGRQRQRGEASRDKVACRTFRMNMPFVIRAVLRHNNEVPVPELLTIEMRQDNVQPTRRAIYEWFVRKGYCASEPGDLTSLRTQCLPRLNGVIDRGRIFLFDPRHPKRRIKGLMYRNTWLNSSPVSERAAGVTPIEVMLDPNDLRHCYFVRGGELRTADLSTKDPLAEDLTLCEHLLMHDEDGSAVEEQEEQLQERDAERALDNRAVNKSATKAKKAAKDAQKASNVVLDQAGKREARRDEIEREWLIRLGLDPDLAQSGPQETHDSSDEDNDKELPGPRSFAPAQGAEAALMQKIRAMSRSK